MIYMYFSDRFFRIAQVAVEEEKVGPEMATVVQFTLILAVLGLVLGLFVAVYRNRDEQQDDLSSPTETDRSSPTPLAKSEPTHSQVDDSASSEMIGSTADSSASGTIPTTPRLSLSYDDIRKDDPFGSGGNADVYYATAVTEGDEIELALKEPRLSGTLHTETVDRMLKEAETWQKLDDHDHIVDIVDYGGDPLPWIAMEYMDAGHLGARAGELELDQTLWTAIATTNAVRHAHRRGVAHLDLKPENILFRSVKDAWDVPKVADWGLSKHLLDHSKSVEGISPHYAAPEQFDETFGSPDDITDVYQLGAVFYELFTGQLPFEGQPTRIMRSVLDEEPTPPSKIADVPPELDEILLTALAKEKDDRYETVLYLRDELQQLQ
jgi:hypothetical protein